jgi:ribosome-binding protein aMBF1 (putative translation factor)
MYQNFQDWTEVKFVKKDNKKKNIPTTSTSSTTLISSSVSNYTAQKPSMNKAGSSGLNDKVMSAKKLESEDETFKHKTLTLSTSKRIAQKRCEMKLTQKDLAMKLSLPESIIKSYEKGDVIPNPSVLNKIEKVLGRVRD